jgi:hypothetical protein
VAQANKAECQQQQQQLEVQRVSQQRPASMTDLPAAARLAAGGSLLLLLLLLLGLVAVVQD